LILLHNEMIIFTLRKQNLRVFFYDDLLVIVKLIDNKLVVIFFFIIKLLYILKSENLKRNFQVIFSFFNHSKHNKIFLLSLKS